MTSDYATVIKSDLRDIHIADKARFTPESDYHFRTILHSNDASCDLIGIKNYAVTHMNDTEGESCDLELRYNDKNGLNIWNHVMAHEVDPCQEADIEALGFTWKLELMKNFTYGINNTDQAEYVSFDPVTGILKVDGYKESAIDRTPVIRVRLMDGNKTVKVAYIKVKIVRDAPEPLVDYTEAFMLGKDFVFDCNNDDKHMISYDYKDFSVMILDRYAWSKKEFHEIYPDTMDIKVVPFDFKDPDGNVVRVTKEAGWVKERLNNLDQLEEGTHVLEWFISNDELWNLAEDASQGGKPVTVYNRYRYYNKSNGRYFDIVLISTVQPINKTYPIKEPSYIDNYWFPTGTYEYTKLNVNVPDPENTEDHTKCIFNVDLNTAFVTQNGFIKISGTDFPVTGLHYMFCKDMTSKGYTIQNNGTELWYGNNKICWLENAPAYNKFRYNKENDKAKELLNRGDMEVYIAAKGLICGKYEVGFTFAGGKDHFVAKVIRPVTLSGNAVHPDYFIDGVDYGEAHSYVDCDQFLNRLVDWRERDFANHPSFWGYYGPFSCTFQTNTAVCNLKVDGVEAWRPLPSTIDFRYQPTPWDDMNMANRFGWLTYKNNGTNVDEDFYIKVDLDIHYGWGTYTVKDVQILVQSTKNTPAP